MVEMKPTSSTEASGVGEAGSCQTTDSVLLESSCSVKVNVSIPPSSARSCGAKNMRRSAMEQIPTNSERRINTFS